MVVATVAPAVAGAMMAAAKAAARRMTAVRAAAARAVVAMAQAVTVVADWLATRKVAVAIRVEARAVETTKTPEMTDRVRERGAGMHGGVVAASACWRGTAYRQPVRCRGGPRGAHRTQAWLLDEVLWRKWGQSALDDGRLLTCHVTDPRGRLRHVLRSYVNQQIRR